MRLRGSELLKGAIDMHVHPLDNPPLGLPDYIDIAREMKAAEMAGVVFKPHFIPTTSAAFIVNQIVPDFHVCGGLIMEGGAGGLNPYVVRNQIEIGAKVIWMPLWTQHYWDVQLSDPRGYMTRERMEREIRFHGPLWSYLDDNGELCTAIRSNMEEIWGLIADADVIFNTGHASAQEALVLVEEAKTAGVKKIVVDHPLSIANKATIEQQKEMVKKGAFLEQTWAKMLNPQEYAEAIKAVGAEHTVMSTDYGGGLHPPPIEAMREYIGHMKRFGVTDREIKVMIETNPRYLLGM